MTDGFSKCHKMLNIIIIIKYFLGQLQCRIRSGSLHSFERFKINFQDLWQITKRVNNFFQQMKVLIERIELQ